MATPAITWAVKVDGDDILVSGQASWFGGPSDSGDNGETASGVDNSRLGVTGCALPVPTCSATAGSPLPVLPYLQTKVLIQAGVKAVLVPLIDVVPAINLNRPIDLTPQTFKDLGGDIPTGLLPVKFRILGGALYIKQPV
jgi:hypothetical protein